MRNAIQLVKNGTLTVPGFENMMCANLRVGSKVLRVIEMRAFYGIMGFKSIRTGLKNCHILLAHPKAIGETAKTLRSRLDGSFVVVVNGEPVRFYDCELLIDFANFVINLKSVGALGDEWFDVALNCRCFIQASAKLGLVGMIDEATGYDKGRDEYQQLFRQFIQDVHGSWVKEFPDSFFAGVYKIYHAVKHGKNHPPYFGGFIAKYVYWPLADSRGAILEKLRAKNPVVNYKGRRYKLHQFLTEEVGKKALHDHIVKISTVMELSGDKGAFRRNFKKAFPRMGDQLEFEFDDDV